MTLNIGKLTFDFVKENKTTYFLYLRIMGLLSLVFTFPFFKSWGIKKMIKIFITAHNDFFVLLWTPHASKRVNGLLILDNFNVMFFFH